MRPYQIVRLTELLQIPELDLLDLASELDETGKGFLSLNERHELHRILVESLVGSATAYRAPLWSAAYG
eukprot:7724784-Prorocentrum_lima.AAC.1